MDRNLETWGRNLEPLKLKIYLCYYDFILHEKYCLPYLLYTNLICTSITSKLSIKSRVQSFRPRNMYFWLERGGPRAELSVRWHANSSFTRHGRLSFRILYPLLLSLYFYFLPNVTLSFCIYLSKAFLAKINFNFFSVCYLSHLIKFKVGSEDKKMLSFLFKF